MDAIANSALTLWALEINWADFFEGVLHALGLGAVVLAVIYFLKKRREE